jgi:ankyrin repeat protein
MANGSEGERLENAWQLNAAIRAGNIASVTAMLDEGVSPHQCDSVRQEPLFVAITNEKPGIVKLLLDRGVDPNAPVFRHGRTPLYHAAETGNIEIVYLLLNKGARADTPDEMGLTPLYICANRALTIVLNVPDKASWRRAQDTARDGYVAVAKALVAAGADVNAAPKLKDYYPPAHFLRETGVPSLMAIAGPEPQKRSFLSGLFGRS